MQFSPVKGPQHRVRVQGVVAYQQPGGRVSPGEWTGLPRHDPAGHQTCRGDVVECRASRCRNARARTWGRSLSRSGPGMLPNPSGSIVRPVGTNDGAPGCHRRKSIAVEPSLMASIFSCSRMTDLRSHVEPHSC